jgi:hypothetical protein
MCLEVHIKFKMHSEIFQSYPAKRIKKVKDYIADAIKFWRDAGFLYGLIERDARALALVLEPIAREAVDSNSYSRWTETIAIPIAKHCLAHYKHKIKDAKIFLDHIETRLGGDKEIMIQEALDRHNQDPYFKDKEKATSSSEIDWEAEFALVLSYETAKLKL